MKTIKFFNTKKRLLIVSDEDYDRVMQYKWSYYTSYSGDKIYSTVNVDGERLRIANFVMQNNEVMYDHIDRYICNNQRDNLRPSTDSENQANKSIYKNNKSGYKGVTWHEKSQKWRVSLTHNKQAIHIGLFSSKEKAALAYNKAARFHHGEFAVLNVLSTEE